MGKRGEVFVEPTDLHFPLASFPSTPQDAGRSKAVYISPDEYLDLSTMLYTVMSCTSIV